MTIHLERGGPVDEDTVDGPRPDTTASLPFAVELVDRGDLCLLRLKGALTGASIAALESQIDQIGCTGWDRVIVDVSELTRLDDTGNSVLAGLHHYMQGRGGSLVLTGAKGPLLWRLARGPYLIDPAEGIELIRGGTDHFVTGSPVTSAARGVPSVRFAGAVEEQSSRSNQTAFDG